MSLQNTPRLGLPLLQPGQAQKHITLNESLWRLEALAQAAVLSRTVALQPDDPADGDAYILPESAAGASWDDAEAGDYRVFQAGYWSPLSLPEGALVRVLDEGAYLVRTMTGWVKLQDSFDAIRNLPELGVNATADATNRLSVNSPQVLFNHAGAGSQVFINKAATTGDAAVVLQKDFSTRALIGVLDGASEALSVKYSPDGAAFGTVFRADPAAQSLTFSPQGENGPTAVFVGSNRIGTSFVSGYPAMEISEGMSGDRYAYFDFRASDDQPDYSARFIRYPGAYGVFEINNQGGDINLCPSSGGVSLFSAGVVRTCQSTSSLSPALDNAYSLGASGARWSSVWAANGVIQTSDGRDKTVASVISGETATALMARVDPVFFRWNEGGSQAVETGRRHEMMNPDAPGAKAVERVDTQVVSRPGQRLHAGFVAQSVAGAMHDLDLDFGVWGLEDAADADSRQWLRPDQLIPVLWAALKAVQARLAVLEGN